MVYLVFLNHGIVTHGQADDPFVRNNSLRSMERMCGRIYLGNGARYNVGHCRVLCIKKGVQSVRKTVPVSISLKKLSKRS